MKRKAIYILSPESLAEFKKNLTPETKDIKDVMALSGKILISCVLAPLHTPLLRLQKSHSKKTSPQHTL